MLEKEGQEIRDCVEAMMQNLPFFEGIRQDGNEYEVPEIKTIHGMQFKGKADIVGKISTKYTLSEDAITEIKVILKATKELTAK